jgi:hypothetical protein
MGFLRAIVGVSVLATAVLSGCTAFDRAVVLTVRLPREAHRVAAAAETRVGERVVLAYRHSVEGTRVKGHFRVVTGPGLKIEETRMTSVGTGMPNTHPGRTRREGEWLVVDESGNAPAALRFFLSAVNLTRLSVAGRAVPLDHVPSGTLLAIAVEAPPRLRLWLWRAAAVSWRKPPGTDFDGQDRN